MSNILFIGHRGSGPTKRDSDHTFPFENTIASFKHAINNGVDGIEFDVLGSKDDQVMVFHDDELWKKLPLPDGETRQTFKISEKTCEELQRLSDVKIATLQEVINLVKKEKQDLILNIDIKDNSIWNICLDILISNDMDFSNIYFCSFYHDTLLKMKKRVPDIHIFPNTKKFNETELQKLMERQNFSGYDISCENLTNTFVQIINQSKREVFLIERSGSVDFTWIKNLEKIDKNIKIFLKCSDVKRMKEIFHTAI